MKTTHWSEYGDEPVFCETIAVDGDEPESAFFYSVHDLATRAREGGVSLPETCRGARHPKLRLDARGIVDDALEYSPDLEGFDDAPYEPKDFDVPGLQKLLDGWLAEQPTSSWWIGDAAVTVDLTGLEEHTRERMAGNDAVLEKFEKGKGR